MKLPENARIFIIEGIAGAGKTTFHDQLIGSLRARGKKVYDFIEEELMLGWKHIHVPGISDLRLEFLGKFIDYCENKMENEPDSVFIFNRFHVSVGVLELKPSKIFMKKYGDFVERVKRLPVFIYVPVLDVNQIKERAVHKERDEQWKTYLKEKLELRGFSNFGDLYKAEQDKILKLVEEQGIPYEIIKVKVDH